MKKKKISLKNIKHDEILNAYKKVNEFLDNLEEEYQNIKKLEEENS